MVAVVTKCFLISILKKIRHQLKKKKKNEQIRELGGVKKERGKERGKKGKRKGMRRKPFGHEINLHLN